MYVQKDFITAFCSLKSCKKPIYTTENEVVVREEVEYPKYFHLRCFWSWHVSQFVKGEKA